MKHARLTKAGIFTPRTRTRATDPATSTAAFETLDVGLVQRRVLSLFRLPSLTLDGCATHRLLIHDYRRIYGATVAESTVRTRVAELVDLGLMTACGTTGETRTETVWTLTEKGREVCRRMD